MHDMPPKVPPDHGPGHNDDSQPSTSTSSGPNQQPARSTGSIEVDDDYRDISRQSSLLLLRQIRQQRQQRQQRPHPSQWRPPPQSPLVPRSERREAATAVKNEANEPVQNGPTELVTPSGMRNGSKGSSNLEGEMPGSVAPTGRWPVDTDSRSSMMEVDSVRQSPSSGLSPNPPRPEDLESQTTEADEGNTEQHRLSEQSYQSCPSARHTAQDDIIEVREDHRADMMQLDEDFYGDIAPKQDDGSAGLMDMPPPPLPPWGGIRFRRAIEAAANSHSVTLNPPRMRRRLRKRVVREGERKKKDGERPTAEITDAQNSEPSTS